MESNNQHFLSNGYKNTSSSFSVTFKVKKSKKSKKKVKKSKFHREDYYTNNVSATEFGRNFQNTWQPKKYKFHRERFSVKNNKYGKHKWNNNSSYSENYKCDRLDTTHSKRFSLPNCFNANDQKRSQILDPYYKQHNKKVNLNAAEHCAKKVKRNKTISEDSVVKQENSKLNVSVGGTNPEIKIKGDNKVNICDNELSDINHKIKIKKKTTVPNSKAVLEEESSLEGLNINICENETNSTVTIGKKKKKKRKTDDKNNVDIDCDSFSNLRHKEFKLGQINKSECIKDNSFKKGDSDDDIEILSSEKSVHKKKKKLRKDSRKSLEKDVEVSEDTKNKKSTKANKLKRKKNRNVLINISESECEIVDSDNASRKKNTTLDLSDDCIINTCKKNKKQFLEESIINVDDTELPKPKKKKHKISSTETETLHNDQSLTDLEIVPKRKKVKKKSTAIDYEPLAAVISESECEIIDSKYSVKGKTNTINIESDDSVNSVNKKKSKRDSRQADKIFENIYNSFIKISESNNNNKNPNDETDEVSLIEDIPSKPKKKKRKRSQIESNSVDQQCSITEADLNFNGEADEVTFIDLSKPKKKKSKKYANVNEQPSQPKQKEQGMLTTEVDSDLKTLNEELYQSSESLESCKNPVNTYIKFIDEYVPHKRKKKKIKQCLTESNIVDEQCLVSSKKKKHKIPTSEDISTSASEEYIPSKTKEKGLETEFITIDEPTTESCNQSSDCFENISRKSSIKKENLLISQPTDDVTTSISKCEAINPLDSNKKHKSINMELYDCVNNASAPKIKTKNKNTQEDKIFESINNYFKEIGTGGDEIQINYTYENVLPKLEKKKYKQSQIDTKVDLTLPSKVETGEADACLTIIEQNKPSTSRKLKLESSTPHEPEKDELIQKLLDEKLLYLSGLSNNLELESTLTDPASKPKKEKHRKYTTEELTKSKKKKRNSLQIKDAFDDIADVTDDSELIDHEMKYGKYKKLVIKSYKQLKNAASSSITECSDISNDESIDSSMHSQKKVNITVNGEVGSNTQNNSKKKDNSIERNGVSEKNLTNQNVFKLKEEKCKRVCDDYKNPQYINVKYSDSESTYFEEDNFDVGTGTCIRSSENIFNGNNFADYQQQQNVKETSPAEIINDLIKTEHVKESHSLNGISANSQIPDNAKTKQKLPLSLHLIKIENPEVSDVSRPPSVTIKQEFDFEDSAQAEILPNSVTNTDLQITEHPGIDPVTEIESENYDNTYAVPAIYDSDKEYNILCHTKQNTKHSYECEDTAKDMGNESSSNSDSDSDESDMFFPGNVYKKEVEATEEGIKYSPAEDQNKKNQKLSVFGKFMLEIEPESQPEKEKSFVEEVNLDSEEYADEKDKIRCLNVIFPFSIPPIHALITRTTTVPRQQMEQIKSLNIPIKNGPFSKEEDEKIMRNWEQFCKEHDVRMIPSLFLKFPTRMRHETRVNILRYLAHGLDNRLLNRVYIRFKHLLQLQNLNFGRYTPEEDKTILDYIVRTESMHPFTDLGKILRRTPISVEKRYDLLTRSDNRSNDWTPENVDRFIKCMMKVTKCEKLEDLEHTELTTKQWKKISKKMDNIPVLKLQRGWSIIIYPRLFSETVDLRKVKENIIHVLYDRKETDWRTVNWKEIAKQFKGFTAEKIYIMFKHLVYFHIPKEKHGNLAVCLDFLKNKLLKYCHKLPTRHKFKKFVFKDGRITYDNSEDQGSK